MKLYVHVWALAAILGMALSPSPAIADEIQAQGQALLSQHRDAVITVQLVVQQQFSMMGMGGSEEEAKVEATGAVIDPGGLTVLSLTAIDPMGLTKSLMSSMMGGMGQDLDMSSQVVSAKMLLGDRTEIPASVVLRDQDLDLAFVRPLEEPAAPLAYIDLRQTATPGPLESVVTLLRLSQVANREAGLLASRISAIIDTPRTFYTSDMQAGSMNALGAPVFLLDGNVAGISVLRVIQTPSDGGGGLGALMSGAMNAGQNMAIIIVPPSDVLDAAAQVPARGEESPGEPSLSPDEETEKEAAPAPETAPRSTSR